MIGQIGGSACIGIIRRVGKSLLLKPCLFLIILRDVNTFNLENDRPGAVIAASDHHAIVIRPAFHDGTALERGINVPADSIPCLSTELTVHQMIEVILLWRSFEQKCIPNIEERARTRFGISQVLLLIISEALKYL